MSGNNGPLVLVVDDENEYRETRTELLEAHGFHAIGAASVAEAHRELRASPAIDLAVIDINLDLTKPKDMSGIELARDIQAAWPSLPIVGYSGRIAEEDVPKAFLKDFADLHQKGDPLPLDRVKDWYRLAVSYRSRRISLARDELERLREKYGIEHHDYSLLREFVPGMLRPGEDVLPSCPEDILRSAGYTLRIIEKDQVRPTVDNTPERLRATICLWIHSGMDHVAAQVYGIPELYSHGDNDQEAIRNVLLLMDGYNRDLSSSCDQSLSPVLVQMRDFLRHSLG